MKLYNCFAKVGFFCLLTLCGCKDNKEKATVAPPVKVDVIIVSDTDNINVSTYSGTVSSSEITTVSFSVAGTIENLSVEEGKKVTKGQYLGKVSDSDYVNAANIAEAELAEARDGYDRLKKLYDAKALPEVKWVEMQQKLKQAENAAEMAQRAVKDAVLHSPVNGTVTRKLADVGQHILPVEPVYEIVSTEALTIDIPVSESAIGDFQLGRKAYVSFDSESLPEVEGKITQKSVVADPLTRSYTIKIAIPSGGGKLLPGMIGNVRFESDSTQSVKTISLPSQAVLLNEDNRLFVWIVRNNKAERRFVEADELVKQGIAVKSGLERGDTVIVAGMQKVGSGTIVIPQIK